MEGLDAAGAAAGAAGAAAAGGAAGGAGISAAWAQRLAVPWGPLLTQEEALRGLTYYGSGQRMQAVAKKLMAGKPIKVRGEWGSRGVLGAVASPLWCDVQPLPPPPPLLSPACAKLTCLHLPPVSAARCSRWGPA